MKGIILAGGAGTRLYPLTKITSKQLLPIYDQPMIYYPLQTLLDGGIKEILLISDPVNIGNFVRLLGSGKDFNCKITYEIQDKPEGLAQAFLIGDNFIADDNVTMILGDNLFIGDKNFLHDAIANFTSGGRIFVKQVQDPQRFGVAEFDKNKQVVNIIEKPKDARSDYAVTGLYIYDQSVVKRAKTLHPSERGELEITDLNNLYLRDKQLKVDIYPGHWLDTGTFDSLLAASNLIAQIKQNG